MAQVGLLLLCLAAASSKAQTYTILHEFGTNESGVWPQGALVQGPDGTLYGATRAGGLANQGQVFKIQPDGTGFVSLRDFSGTDGASPWAGVVLSGTTLYGTTCSGGVSNLGTVFRLNTDGNGFTVLKEFTGSDGASPSAGLCVVDWTLYGTTSSGGVSNKGTVFKLNTDGSGYASLRDFSGGDGAGPWAGVVLSGTTLYGTTYSGGISNMGTVFKLNTDGGSFTVLKEFTGSDGASPRAGLCVAEEVLYGATYRGGTPNGGTVFKLNTDGSGYTLLRQFDGSDGLNPIGDLALSGDTLYGRTVLGVTNSQSRGNGVVFRLKTDGGDYAVVRSFTAEEEPNPRGGPTPFVPLAGGLLVSGATLYGTSPVGGAGTLGRLFQLNTNGSGYLVLKQFTGGDGKRPYSGLAQDADGVLYGTTERGGAVDAGTVFKIHSDGSGYTFLKQFDGSEGAKPEAGLAIGGATLYGTTAYGGISNYGTLFKINADGSGYSPLRVFTSYDDGVYPATVPVLSGTTLYGGIGYGKIFHINTDGSGYTFLSIDTSGGAPGSVLLEGSTLYGTEQEGGPSYGSGMVYRINTDGSGLTLLKVMGGDAGSWPNGPLVLGGGTLYGTASSGGTYSRGTVFKVDTSGAGFSVLKQFTGGSDGGYPEAGLVLSGDTLYGTTGGGGNFGYGTVFRINANGLDFAVLKSFSGSDGSFPYGNLMLSGTNLYGTTMYGGSLDQGVVFKLGLPAAVQGQFTYTINNGTVAIIAYTGPGGAVAVPGKINGLFVTSIGDDAFAGCTSLTSVTIPSSVTSIGGGAFSGCTNLTTIPLPSSVTTIGDEAFYHCTSLTNVTLPNSLTSIGAAAFSGCTSLTSVTIPYGVTSIGEAALAYCTSLTSVTIPNSVTRIGDSAFGGCVSLTHVTIPDRLSEIGRFVFASANLTNAPIPDSVTRIGFGAFQYCTRLTSLTIPSGVTNLGDYAFYACTNLTEVSFNGDAPTLGGSDVFSDDNNATVYYFRGTTGWDSTFGGRPAVLWVQVPAVQTPPQTQTAEAGSAVGLSVDANSPLPLFYLWCRDDTNLISCSTHCELALTNVQFSQSGAYTVVISNVLGAATSGPAMLNVIAAVERRPVPGVEVTGGAGSMLNVDYADSLSHAPNWTTLGSVSLNSTSQYCFDLTLPLPPQRFYRAWQTGTPSVVPSLDLHLVPAITLTGTLGGSVRVDAINQFGPTDAWVPLDTVPLTNTSQLYFDVSAWGQPQRLYRLVQIP